MNQSDQIFVFLDTNVALHYRRPDQIEWGDLTNSKEVVLVVAPVIVFELDDKKFSSSSKKIRDRAASFISWLDGVRQSSSPAVRENVQMQFVTTEPTTAFESNALSRENRDDRLIATALEFKVEDSARKAIATADLGLKLKLVSRDIEAISLPDQLKLPSIPDEHEKEKEALRSRIFALEARRPALDAIWSNGETNLEIVNTEHLDVDPPEPLEDIVLKYKKLVGHTVARDAFDPSDDRFASAAARTTVTGLSPMQISSYNTELDDYYARYGKYLVEFASWQTRRSLSIENRIAIRNTGTSVASHIDIDISFPEQVILGYKGYYESPPTPPQAPSIDAIDLLKGGRLISLGTPIQNQELDWSVLTKGTKIDKENSLVRVKCNLLKHNSQYKGDAFYIGLETNNIQSPLRIPYRITCAELPEPVDGNLTLALA